MSQNPGGKNKKNSEKVFNRFLLEPFILPKDLHYPQVDQGLDHMEFDENMQAFHLAAIIGYNQRNNGQYVNGAG